MERIAQLHIERLPEQPVGLSSRVRRTPFWLTASSAAPDDAFSSSYAEWLAKVSGISSMIFSLLRNTLLITMLVITSNAFSEPRTSPALNSVGFLSYHPDIRWRNEAIEHYDRMEYVEAIRDLTRSAKYADKGSQGLLAEMHWKGLGTPPNRALGYAWMDLAADSGYQEFVVLRELYWSKLSEEEKRTALALGKEIYATYGDDVAKPRLAKLLDQGRRKVTGSKTGFRGPIQIAVRMPGGGFAYMNADQFYADEFWKPHLYFEWKKKVWNEGLKGTVEVGPLETVD